MANERTAAADTRETLRNKLGALELSLFAIRSHRIMADDLLLQLLEIIVHFIWENVSIDYGRMVGMEDGEVSNPINIYFDRIFPSVPTNPSLAPSLFSFLMFSLIFFFCCWNWFVSKLNFLPRGTMIIWFYGLPALWSIAHLVNCWLAVHIRNWLTISLLTNCSHPFSRRGDRWRSAVKS